MVNSAALGLARAGTARPRRPSVPFQAVVVPMIVGSMLPIPLITIRSAGFGFGTMAAPIVLGLGLMLAHARRQRLTFFFLPLFALVMAVGLISIWNSWLFWNPNVPTGIERGSGHRWIVYQLTALYFLATPFLGFLAGMLYAQLQPSLRWLYVGVLLSVTVTTLLGIWSWWHNPVNPIDVYTKGIRPNINPDATMFILALSAGILVWQYGRWRWWIPGLLIFALGLLGAYLSYALNIWLGALGALTVLAWSRWSWKGLLGWLGGLALFALAVQSTIGTIIDQRLASQDLDRIGLWHSALIVWSKSPWLGVGPGNLTSYMERFSVFSIALVLQGYQQAHNIFLELLAENGVIGLSLFLLFIVIVIWRLGRQPANHNVFNRHFQSVALAMLVGSALMATVGSGIVPTIASAGWDGLPPVLVVWFFAGAAAALTLPRGKGRVSLPLVEGASTSRSLPLVGRAGEGV